MKQKIENWSLYALVIILYSALALAIIEKIYELISGVK